MVDDNFQAQIAPIVKRLQDESNLLKEFIRQNESLVGHPTFDQQVQAMQNNIVMLQKAVQ